MKEFPLNNRWISRLTAIYAQRIIFDKYNIETKLKKSKNKMWELKEIPKDNERRPTKKFKKRENKKHPYKVKRKTSG